MRDVKQILSETIDVKTRLLNDPEVLADVETVIEQMIRCYRDGGRVFFCGNGGSAADAQHFAAELTGHFIFDRPPLAAEALHGNSSHLTAVANDYAYDEVFARALEGGARAGDVLIGLTTSGSSGSIVRAAEVGRELGVFVVGMTGESGGKLKDVADVCIRIPSSDTGRIQESHTTLVHAISEAVEFAIFGHLAGHTHD